MVLRIGLYDDEMEIVIKGVTDDVITSIIGILDNASVYYTKNSTRIVVSNPTYAILNEMTLDNYLFMM